MKKKDKRTVRYKKIKECSTILAQATRVCVYELERIKGRKFVTPVHSVARVWYLRTGYSFWMHEQMLCLGELAAICTACVSLRQQWSVLVRICIYLPGCPY